MPEAKVVVALEAPQFTMFTELPQVRAGMLKVVRPVASSRTGAEIVPVPGTLFEAITKRPLPLTVPLKLMGPVLVTLRLELMLKVPATFNVLEAIKLLEAVTVAVLDAVKL